MQPPCIYQMKRAQNQNYKFYNFGPSNKMRSWHEKYRVTCLNQNYQFHNFGFHSKCSYQWAFQSSCKQIQNYKFYNFGFNQSSSIYAPKAYVFTDPDHCSNSLFTPNIKETTSLMVKSWRTSERHKVDWMVKSFWAVVSITFQ